MLKKLERDYDPTNREAAMLLLEETRAHQILATGLIYINKDQPPLQEVEDLVDTPLTKLGEKDLRPSPESLLEVLESFR
jgi:2-oxoglutarate ferredoxin oxidoreductase subunit beta